MRLKVGVSIRVRDRGVQKLGLAFRLGLEAAKGWVNIQKRTQDGNIRSNCSAILIQTLYIHIQIFQTGRLPDPWDIRPVFPQIKKVGQRKKSKETIKYSL